MGRCIIPLTHAQLSKDDALTIVSILILLFTAIFNWTFTSYLILIAVVILILAWYFKGR
jgi:hypothetical protein